MEQQLALMLLMFMTFGFPLLILFIFFLIEMMNSKKSMFLFFDTTYHCRLIRQKIKDGKVKIGKKIFFIGDYKPKLLRTGSLFKSYKPFYILRHDVANPYRFDDENLEIKITPENVKYLSRNTTLEQLLRGATGSGAWLWLIIGLVMGILIGYMLVSSGIFGTPAG